MGPEYEAGVDFCGGVDGVGPEEGLGEGLDDGFIFSSGLLVVRFRRLHVITY